MRVKQSLKFASSDPAGTGSRIRFMDMVSVPLQRLWSGCAGLAMGAALVACFALADDLLCQTGASRSQLESTYQAAETAFREQRLDVAADGYRKLVGLSPDTAEVHAKLGLIEYLRGRFGEAVPALRAALKLKPGLPNVNTLLSISLAELGQFREALPGLENGFEDPADSDLRRLIGLELQRSYSALGRPHDASRTMGKLSELYPDDPEILYHSGRFFADLAASSMRRLLDVAPDSVWGHQAAAEALDSQGNYDLAVVEYRKVLAEQPGRPGVHYSIARAIQRSGGKAGSEADAIAAFREELRVDPSNALAAYELGEIHRKSGRLGEALDLFRQAVRHRPDFALGRIGLGRVLRESEDLSGARTHLEAATRLSPENEVARYQLALVYRGLGDLDGARREMEAFQRLQGRQSGNPEESRLPFQREDSTLQRLDPNEQGR